MECSIRGKRGSRPHADWLCHRAADLAHRTGPKESLIHLLMFAEVGLPLLAGIR